MKISLLAVALLLAACSSSPSSTTAGGSSGSSGSGGTAGVSGASGSGGNAGNAGAAGDIDGGFDADPGQPDGDPTRQNCTNNFGNALTTQFGRLDGILVSIVHVGANQCNGDADHVHLQIQSNGKIYDVAVNMQSDQAGDPNVQYLEKNLAWVGDPWSEGWHTGMLLDYWGNLKLHSTEFTAFSMNTLAQKVEDALATVNHISVWGYGYGPDGMHKIHRNVVNKDGAIVLEPLSNSPRYLLFHFVDQTF
jgi:uncharacterized protein YukJ